MEFKVFPNAKINIGLNIEGVLENGYHLLDMTMLPVDLSDILEGKIFNETGSLTIKTNKKDIPTDESNILYKVYKEFYNKLGITPLKIDIFLEKRIPHQAGLGGGSSDGAFFLNILNDYHKKPFSINELIEIGKNIGADVPFFIINEPSRVKGIGEEIEVIKNNVKIPIVIIKPNFGISTALAYKEIKKIKVPKMADISEIIRGLESGDLSLFQDKIENNLEEALLLGDERTQEFKKQLEDIEGIRFYMSGSGSAYYGFLLKDIDKIFCNVKQRFKSCEIFLCNFK
ncbi:4-(cytidine 5'-diphospho)-2-C-methyl-D-erythritol kinase [uncultured Cetobacterium sp.]|uniref:4-(cytidine 5'-diphospho)-2-C-methyl-D-erythritol kinase n=1 Tax=uncultured Cetobacterium sp. TaxID=527638 RepID=UPI002614856B|nr:4-(cytidine 5'-diphospho)-2-C-methyl-D-erythritol kinase [uncultured Cetobacterium sp.]